METIFALASARGRSGVAVVRISGPEAYKTGRDLTGHDLPLRRPVLRKIFDTDGELIDEGLLLAFPDGASFTGEATLEIHTHGSSAVIAALLGDLARRAGLRLAVPGEFTRRALENDKLDLTRVEGLADLIDAETELQRRQALRVMSGDLSDRTSAWRARLIRAVALLEATIDFADEEVPTDVFPEVLLLISEVAEALTKELTGTWAAERIREGFEVAIIGPPNVGKSSLLNALAGRSAAITSEVAGTTRDVIEVRMDLAGLPVILLDTAGMRETSDVVERIGVDRAQQRASAADLRVFLVNPGEAPALTPKDEDLVVTSKADLRAVEGLSVSAVTGQGLDELTARVASVLEKRAAGSGLVIRERQKVAMERATQYIVSAQTEIRCRRDRPEVAADDLHQAIRALDVLIGRVDVEDVLDEIFSSFCLGK